MVVKTQDERKCSHSAAYSCATSERLATKDAFQETPQYRFAAKDTCDTFADTRHHQVSQPSSLCIDQNT